MSSIVPEREISCVPSSEKLTWNRGSRVVSWNGSAIEFASRFSISLRNNPIRRGCRNGAGPITLVWPLGDLIETVRLPDGKRKGIVGTLIGSSVGDRDRQGERLEVV